MGVAAVHQQADRLAWSLMRWAERYPDARTVPPWMQPAINQLNRYLDVEASMEGGTVRVMDPAHRIELELIRHELEAESTDRAKRRQVEAELADYVESCQGHTIMDLGKVAEAMRNCRQSGTVGIRPGGGHVVAWDAKCGLVRLCPDEAREETQRLAERYLPAMMEWVKGKATRRLFYAVLTWGNFEPGRLTHGKRFLFDRLKKKILDGKFQACPVDFRVHRGRSALVARKTRKRTMPAFPTIKGALVVQEDPLSARGDWNVHLNVILAVEGPLSFQELRQEWGANLHIRELDRDPQKLRGTLLELVKYSAMHVGEKSTQKATSGATEAPPMVEWDRDRWCEWWASQQRFRRTRSYGCLYGIPEPVSEFDFNDVRWVGAVSFSRATVSYSVHLIPGDNFQGSSARRVPAGGGITREMDRMHDPGGGVPCH